MESVKEGTAQKIIPYFLGYKTNLYLLMGFGGGGIRYYKRNCQYANIKLLYINAFGRKCDIIMDLMRVGWMWTGFICKVENR